MFGKIAIRNIPNDIWSGLEVLAAQHDRSTEAEARHALRSWVTPLIQKNERSARRTEVSARLRELLDQVNQVMHGRQLKPSHIALEIGENYAENVENFFTGETEPSFKQLDAIASFLGGSNEWLKHADGKVFPVEYHRLAEDPNKATTWLLDTEETEKVTFLHLVREADEAGSFAIIKQYGEWQCKTYTTPCHVSEVIGAGGEATLAHLSVTLELLYKLYTTKTTDRSLLIKSYLLPKENFKALYEGHSHPLAAIQGRATEAPWWEDFWDIRQFRSQNYWPGWKSVCERIHHVVNQNKSLQAKLEHIRAN